MAKPNFSEEPQTDMVQPTFDDLSISEPAESGLKGGIVNKDDAIEPDQGNISLVDFLWRHRNS